jgi:serine protease Do
MFTHLCVGHSGCDSAKDRIGEFWMLRTISQKQTILRAGVAALAMVMGGPLLAPSLNASLADAVRVEGVQTVGFADVVEKVQPAVVSVRVKARINNVAMGDENGDEGFGIPGFEDLPKDHPMRRFFKEFGGRGDNQDGQDESRRAEGKRGDDKSGKGRIRPVSQGSGFFISDDGYIVTNNHVVEGGAAFTVVMDDGKEIDAKLVGTDPKTDLALLKVEGDQKFTYVEFADEAGVRVGDWVVAIGNPFGLGGTVTAGIVSGLSRDIGAGPYSDFIQIDAAVNRGNSGGPAFNLKGQVVGINTAIFSPSGGNVGIAFAIPASTAKEVIADLRSSGNVTRGYIGVRIQPLTDELADTLGLKSADGALVANVMPDGPAAKAGIESGDVIVSVDGKNIDGPRQLTRRIGAIAPGETAKLEVMRDGKPVTLSLKLAKLEGEVAAATPEQVAPEDVKPSSIQAFGIEVVPNDKGAGLVIAAVDPDSVAAEQGVRAGDIILEINGETVKAAADIEKALTDTKASARDNVLMRVTRDGDENARFLALPIDKG